MRRALFILLVTLPALPVLALLLAGGGLLWANSESGRAALARLAAEKVPGLAIEGLRGSLPGRIGVARLTMADDQGAWIELEDADIALDLTALWRREFRIAAVTARRIALNRLPPPSGEPPPPPDPDAPLIPPLPSLPVDIRLDRLAVERIELGAPVLGVAAVLSAEGEARLGSAGLTARLEARRLDAPAEARLALDLAPGAGRLTGRVEVTEPPGGLVAGMLGLPERATTARLTLDGPASGAALELTASLGEDITASAHGTLRAAPDGSAGAVLEVQVAAAPLLPEAVRGIAMPARIGLDAAIDAAQRVDLRRLALEVPAGRAEASGGVDLAASTVDLRLALDLLGSAALGGLVPPAARWETLNLQARATGAMTAPRVVLDLAPQGFGSGIAQVAALMGAAPRLHLVAVAPDRIETFTLEGALAHVTAQGAVGETLDATIQARIRDLAPLQPGLAGALEAEAHLTGPRSDPSVALTAHGERVEHQGQVLEAPELMLRIATPLSAPRAEGRLAARYAGLPVTLDLHGTPEGEKLRLERLAAGFGPARLQAQGLVDPQGGTFIGEAGLEVPDLAPFSALAGSALHGRAALLAGFDLRDGVQAIDATLDIPQASVNGTPLGGRATAKGTLAALEAAIEARAEQAQLAARLTMTQAGEDRRLEVPELNLRRGPESIRLTAPARILLAGNGAVRIEALALTTGRGGTLRGEGAWGPEQANLRLSLAALPAAAIVAMGGAAGTLEGSFSAEAQVTGPVAGPSARFRLEGTGLRNPDPTMRGIPAARLVLDGTASATAADVRLEAQAGQALRATGTARLPGGFAATAPLAARLEANIDLATLAGPLLAAGAQRVTGRVVVQAEATGRVGAPVLGGRATLANGSFRDLQQGVTLTDIAATLRGEGQRVVIDRVEARTPGGGRINASGHVSPAEPGLPLDIAITAQNARPLRSDLVTGLMDADLRLTGRVMEDARASGRVTIRRLDITVPEKLPPSVRQLDGVRERGRRPAGTPPLAAPPPPGQGGGGPNIALDVNVVAERAVFVRGRGIDAEFGGQAAIGGSTAAPTVSGGFRMRRGEISMFDRRLNFTRGTISFDAGTFVPTLDFLASSRAREVTANVTVTGPATDPKIEFSSTPELPQDEILSRLLFDRRASELSPFQLAQLAQVLAGAAGLETPGASGILDRIRRTLALDRLSVGEGESQNGQRAQGATLETGRYVADGVYLGVRQGTDGGAPRVGVQIDVLPRVRVEAETGGNSAGGDRLGLNFEWEY